MNKKWLILLVALLTVSLFTAGCTQDPEKLAAAVVVDVDGDTITRGEAQPVYEFMMSQTVQYYAQYGQTIDPNNKDWIASIKEQTMQMMAEGLALEHKLESFGGTFTEEERAGFAERATEEYDNAVKGYVDQYGITEQDAKVSIDSLGYNRVALEYMIYREELDNRLFEYATDDITVTDEEVRAKFDEAAAAAIETYLASPSQYVTDALNGNTVYASPTGFRYVKNLVIPFPEAVTAALDEKNNEYLNKYYESYSDQNQLLTATELTDEERAEIQERIDASTAELTRIGDEMDALMADGYEQMRPDAEAILAKAQEPGADFDALMAEYSSDTATGDLLTVGYPVGAGVTNYVQVFTDGAMALENIGDLSGLIESDYGMHIVKYASDVPAGQADFETVKDALTDEVLKAKKDEAFAAQETEWVNAAKIKTYLKRF